MKRRQFLTLAASTAGAALLPQCASKRAAETLPQYFTSTDGLLDVTLEARYGAVNLANQRPFLLSYNNQVPGPILEAQPGDTVRICLINHLTAPTNLHYHGLHIPPTDKADNPFLEVPPGETFTYEFTLPETHPAGTFWYHPHKHGLVAEQAFGGLSGLLIVRSDLDQIPEIRAAQEAFLVLKDFEIGTNRKIAPPPPIFQMWGREGQLITVNGQVNPNFSIPTNGVLRLRLLNASAARFYRLKLDEHPLHLIATGGGALAEPVELSELLLSPGERAEILVSGEREPGRYRLLNLPYDRGITEMMNGMIERGMMESRVDSDPQTLATFTYGDRVDPLPLPKQLIPVEPLPKPAQVRQFTLNHGIDHQTGAAFLINYQGFDPQRVDTSVPIDSIEDWEIINAASMNHPFHLHVHPFQVISRNGKSEPYHAWRDTVSISGYETVRIRIHFKDFVGKTVYHCHILDHEDKGMMGILDVVEHSVALNR